MEKKCFKDVVDEIYMFSIETLKEYKFKVNSNKFAFNGNSLLEILLDSCEDCPKELKPENNILELTVPSNDNIFSYGSFVVSPVSIRKKLNAINEDPEQKFKTFGDVHIGDFVFKVDSSRCFYGYVVKNKNTYTKGEDGIRYATLTLDESVEESDTKVYTFPANASSFRNESGVWFANSTEISNKDIVEKRSLLFNELEPEKETAEEISKKIMTFGELEAFSTNNKAGAYLVCVKEHENDIPEIYLKKTIVEQFKRISDNTLCFVAVCPGVDKGSYSIDNAYYITVSDNATNTKLTLNKDKEKEQTENVTYTVFTTQEEAQQNVIDSINSYISEYQLYVNSLKQSISETELEIERYNVMINKLCDQIVKHTHKQSDFGSLEIGDKIYAICVAPSYFGETQELEIFNIYLNEEDMVNISTSINWTFIQPKDCLIVNPNWKKYEDGSFIYFSNKNEMNKELEKLLEKAIKDTDNDFKLLETKKQRFSEKLEKLSNETL